MSTPKLPPARAQPLALPPAEISLTPAATMRCGGLCDEKTIRLPQTNGHVARTERTNGARCPFDGRMTRCLVLVGWFRKNDERRGEEKTNEQYTVDVHTITGRHSREHTKNDMTTTTTTSHTTTGSHSREHTKRHNDDDDDDDEEYRLVINPMV
jgi:hypothetical protein